MLVFVNYACFDKKYRNCAFSMNGKQTLEKSQTSKKIIFWQLWNLKQFTTHADAILGNWPSFTYALGIFCGTQVPWRWQKAEKRIDFACDTDLGPKILAARSINDNFS